MEGSDVGDDVRLAGLKELRRREVCNELTFLEQHDALGEIEGFIEIVGDEQDGLLRLGFIQRIEKVAEHVLHFGAGEGIEGAERLVHEKDFGVGGECAGEADALALAAGELVGIAGCVEVRVESDGVQHLVAAANAVGAWAAFGFENQADVALDREVREEAGFLDDVAHAAAELDCVGGANVVPVDQHFTAGWLDHAVDSAEQGGLARTASAEDGGGGSRFELERDSAEQQAALLGREGEIPEGNGFVYGGCGHWPVLPCLLTGHERGHPLLAGGDLRGEMCRGDEVQSGVDAKRRTIIEEASAWTFCFGQHLVCLLYR